MNTKKIKLLTAMVVLVLSIGCSTYYNLFERIEDPYVRTIDFVYRNAADTTLCEAAPGDTVILHAYFGGAPVTAMDWKVSFNVYSDPYGSDTAYDIVPLQYESTLPDTAFTGSATQCISIKFAIPSDIMTYSPSVDDNVLSALGMSREMVQQILDLFLSVPEDQWETNALTAPIMEKLADDVHLIMQVFTVPVRIIAKANGTFNIQSTLMVRYNRFFRRFDKVHVNHNPIINFIGVYKFKSDPYPLAGVDKIGETDSTYVLYSASPAYTTLLGKNCIYSDTILFDPDYTYYVTCDTGVIGTLLDQRDTATSIEYAIGLTPTTKEFPELFYSRWFFELDSMEMDSVPDFNNWLKVGNNENGTDYLFPPLDTAITSATIWLRVKDNFMGERLRKSGSTLREKKVYFKYVPDYMKKVSTK